MFATGYERDLLEIWVGAECGEQILDHCAIDLAIEFFAGLTKPTGEKNVIGLDAVQRLAERTRIEQVGGDGSYPRCGWGWVAGESVNLPSERGQVLCEISADDAGGAGYECCDFQGRSFQSLREARAW